MESTIQLCLADEVMYNMMDEETTMGIWSRLETLYMMKSLSNKLYLKKQLYGLRMKGGTAALEHLNFFNKVISELLTVDVKIDEEDKALIFLSSLLESYDHIVTTMLYGKKTLIFEEVSSTPLSNELGKGQIKRSRQDRVWWSREGKKEEKEEKVQAHQRCHFCHREGHWKNDCKHR